MVSRWSIFMNRVIKGIDYHVTATTISLHFALNYNVIEPTSEKNLYYFPQGLKSKKQFVSLRGHDYGLEKIVSILWIHKIEQRTKVTN